MDVFEPGRCGIKKGELTIIGPCRPSEGKSMLATHLALERQIQEYTDAMKPMRDAMEEFCRLIVADVLRNYVRSMHIGRSKLKARGKNWRTWRPCRSR